MADVQKMVCAAAGVNAYCARSPGKPALETLLQENARRPESGLRPIAPALLPFPAANR